MFVTHKNKNVWNYNYKLQHDFIIDQLYTLNSKSTFIDTKNRYGRRRAAHFSLTRVWNMVLSL